MNDEGISRDVASVVRSLVALYNFAYQLPHFCDRKRSLCRAQTVVRKERRNDAVVKLGKQDRFLVIIERDENLGQIDLRSSNVTTYTEYLTYELYVG